MKLHYYPLINKVITSLSLKDKISFQSLGIEDSFRTPFITIAREPGSGGKPIAQAVAKSLGFVFIDEQIIRDIAKSTKRRKEIIASIDEKCRTRIEDIIHAALNVDYMDDVKYIKELTRVLLYYAHKGKVVILGRGANFVTPFAKGLHVNITAPYNVRVQRAMDYEGLSKDQAKKVVKDIEQERQDFVKKYLSKDIKKSNAYDLTINTEYYEVNEARDIVLEAFYKKFPRTVRYGTILGG